MTRPEREDYLGLGFDLLSPEDVTLHLSRVTQDTPYGYVVTPNVDHLVRIDRDGRDLLPIYQEADLCLCDSKVVSALARRRGIDLPVVTGSDVTKTLFNEVIRRGDRIAIVGGDADLLAALANRYPHVSFAQHRPPMGLSGNAEARAAAAQFIAAERSRFTFMAVGSPQQEMIAAEVRRDYPEAGGMCLCVGASLDFLTGRRRRAPRILRNLGLEWAHRLASEPTRMWRRYLVLGPRIFLIDWKWARSRAAREANRQG